MVDWKIARRRDCCSGCASVFEEGARHVSTLSFGTAELAREDLCLACWERRGAGDELFFWFTRLRSERRGLQLDLPMLEQLFLRLEGREESRILELRYVLCLLLMRKKRLKLVRVVRDPRETMVVRRPRRDESLHVVVCDFGTERIDQLGRELVEIFDGAESFPPASGPPGAPDELPPAPAVELPHSVGS